MSEAVFRFASYTFTDVSPGFFEKTSEKLAAWQDMMIYKKLDIEIDPVEQDLDAGAYDLSVAFQVLHATKNMQRTMANVRKLLKPRGKLILLETTKDALDMQVVFGALPGWWLGEEDERRTSPI
jgi:SAM-dependent methyltransferase